MTGTTIDTPLRDEEPTITAEPSVAVTPAKRHRVSTRIWHWVNLFAVVMLFMSGLNISNAHRYLYWGDWGFSPEQAWLAVPRFPGWATIPGHYSLAEARDWHLLGAWIFGVALLFMWLAMLVNRHFSRDIATSRKEWRWPNVRNDIVQHLRLNFDSGVGKYNFLQKVTYGLVLGVILPLLVFTGMGISPGLEPSFSWMIDAMGGRQSVRSIHFITSWALFAFFVLHVALVLLSGPIRQIRSMITGVLR
ncbi:hypothetical protein HME9302_01431 [Alteripontixanthobacter maritimus]|uniref:Cytochrome b561 bacterial/Ni-hydrogenase domain-containing protein n=1 Tax=Alteripontixanthobacter maritimus TaxID=2161824 RepID=A0A369Q753_9SPHN|nr:cytochrome b/b6 domain-containing protein [Alteripontixanthobacter maritimus]RDC60230.1 hypothetical protein HME9302_01431 [Alteripontixanthobacter maritimus]